MGYIILLCLLLGFILFCISMFISTSKAKKQAKKAMKERKANGITQYMLATHVNGLPIAENTSCQISSLADHYEFDAAGTKFNISKSKVTDVCVKTNVEIQKQYVSSVGGAVAGAVVFGPLGAMIGGRAKEKKSKEFHQYLIFTYESDGEVKYVGFEVTYALSNAQKFVDEFKASGIKNNVTVEL